MQGTDVVFNVQVPAGTALQRFDLDALDDTTDMDLIVYRLSGKGGAPVAGWQSATGAADERVDLLAPAAGYYQVIASMYAGSTRYDLTTFTVASGSGVGAFTVPASIDGVQGEETTYRASWTGLAAGTDYLGLVRYGDGSFSTIVSVKNQG